jgi:membrane-associated protein
VSHEPDLGALAAPTVYLVVLGIVFVESGLLVGFFLPGDTLLFAAGLVAAEPGSGVSLPLLVVGVVVAAVSGDAVGYQIGARGGRPYLERRLDKGRLKRSHLERAERFYARWGWWSVVIARWIPWVRTFVPVLAGVARMPYRRFGSANLVGALGWGAGLVLLGYAAASDPTVRRASYAVAAFFVVGSFVVGGLGYARRRAGGRLRDSG